MSVKLASTWEHRFGLVLYETGFGQCMETVLIEDSTRSGPGTLTPYPTQDTSDDRKRKVTWRDEVEVERS